MKRKTPTLIEMLGDRKRLREEVRKAKDDQIEARRELFRLAGQEVLEFDPKRSERSRGIARFLLRRLENIYGNILLSNIKVLNDKLPGDFDSSEAEESLIKEGQVRVKAWWGERYESTQDCRMKSVSNTEIELFKDVGGIPCTRNITISEEVDEGTQEGKIEKIIVTDIPQVEGVHSRSESYSRAEGLTGSRVPFAEIVEDLWQAERLCREGAAAQPV